jgi:exopolysaccharide production protein ExoQ
MTPPIASVFFVIVISSLFALDRNPTSRTSNAMWIPVMWFSISCSRMVSEWLHVLGWGGFSSTAVSYMDGSPLDRNIFIGLMLIGTPVLLHRKDRVASLLSNNLPLLVFFAYCLCSVAWSDYPDIAFKRYFKAIGDLEMVLIVLSESQQEAAFRRLLSTLGFILLPMSVLLIKYYPDIGRAYEIGDTVSAAWTPMYTGVTATKNFLGLITLLLGIGVIWRLSELLSVKNIAHRRGALIAQTVLLAMTVWLFIKADSATSLSCFIFAVGLIVITTYPALRRKHFLVHGYIAVVSCMSLFALFFQSSGGLLQTLGRNPTLTGRTDIWRLVLKLSENPFLGTGFESFWLGSRLQNMWSVYWWHPNEAHNGYLEVYLNLGWIGIFLITMLFVSGYRNILVARRLDPQLATLKLTYFGVALIYNLTESAIRTLHPLWLFFLLATMAVPQMSAVIEDVHSRFPRGVSLDKNTRFSPRPARGLARLGHS